jgi:DNA-binding FadR family transcriptional regulator
MARGSGYARGSRHGLAKLDEDAVLIIRKSGETIGELSRRYGVSRKTLRQARNRKTWTHVVEGPKEGA